MTSPEDRARAIVDAIKGRQESWNWLAAIIAQAIRQAQNDKLEEAARFADGEAKFRSAWDPKAPGRREAGRRIGRCIRSLKSEQGI